MKHIATLFLSAVAAGAFAAEVHRAALNDLDLDANPQVVTNVTFAGLATANDIAQAAAAATNYTDVASARALASASQNATNYTNYAVANATTGDYENISNRVMQAISLPGDEAHPEWVYSPWFKGYADRAGYAERLELIQSPYALVNNEYRNEYRWGMRYGYNSYTYEYYPFAYLSEVTSAATAGTNYTDAATNAIPRNFLPLSGGTMTGEIDLNGNSIRIGTANEFMGYDPYNSGFVIVLGSASYFFNNTPYSEPTEDDVMRRIDLSGYATHNQATNAATAVVRDLSLGGIWDERLEVWWTPRMRGGSLTYEATTNVNLNAEN